MKFYSKIILSFILIVNIFCLIESGKKECKAKLYPETESIVCVCNTTYCDNFPALQIPNSGLASVYETSKKGDRFKESQLNFEKTSHNLTNANTKQFITIDISQKYQKILGFGGAFTDSTGLNIKSLPENLGKNLIDDYFSSEGLEYSMARTPIGGSDFSTRPYTYDDVNDDKSLKHFALQKEDLEYKIPFMKMAQNVSKYKIKLFGSPWSPPVWMKDNEKIRGGSLKGKVGGEYYQIWANYFVKFLDEYKANGIDMWGITVENEPIEGQNPKQGINGLSLYPNQERDFVKDNLGPTLAKAGYNKTNLKLMIFDENIPQILNWSQTILTDKESAKWVSGIAFHWYRNPEVPNPGLILDTVHEKYPEYFLLNTEASSVHKYGDWISAEKYAFDIIRDLNHWTTGYVDWNMALNMEGGPSWVNGDRLSSPIYVNSSAQQYQKEPLFYIMGHFSKFLPPDSVRIGIKLIVNIDKLYATAFVRPDNAIVLIVVNLNDNEIELNINEPKNGYLVNKIMAHSTQSYIWK